MTLNRERISDGETDTLHDRIIGHIDMVPGRRENTGGNLRTVNFLKSNDIRIDTTRVTTQTLNIFGRTMIDIFR